MSRSRRPLEFFVDRSLGRHRLLEALRRAGWTLRTHHEVYGERDEQVPDVEWLKLCGQRGLPVLSKDRRLRYRPAEIEAIRRFGVRTFLLTSGSLLATEQAAASIAAVKTSKGRAVRLDRSYTPCRLSGS